MPDREITIEDLLGESVSLGASDLHVTSGEVPMMRINGDLLPLKNIAPINEAVINNFINTMLNPTQKKEFKEMLELDFSVKITTLGAFRANIFHQRDGISIVFRVIPKDIPTLESLETPPIFKDILNLSSGLILITGPTGCGKTTTLAAMINYLNHTQRSHIITIEDPIEFIHSNHKSLIHQRQVFRDTVSFTQALRSALREDPDVILVGEMRDLETIRLALTASETGHLVLATLHTSAAPRAISRIIDVFPAGEKNIIRNLISESLQAVICQTLVKKISGGRIAAFEIMLGTPAVRNLIREDKIAQMYSVLQTSSQLGMCTMKQYIDKLIENNIIDSNAAAESGFQRELFEK